MKRKSSLRTVIKLVAISTITMHVVNRIINASAALLDKLDLVPRKRTFNWQFGDIIYTKKGQGAPLLLLHDLHPGASGYEWSRIEDQLSKEHTLYIVDLPGCGRSDKEIKTYTNFTFVRLICDFIKQVIKEPTTVVTSGYTGSLAVMAARYNHTLFSSITMINPPDPDILVKNPGLKGRITKKLIELPILGTFLYYIIMSKDNLENDFVEKYYFNPFHVDGDVIDTYYEASHKKGTGGKYLYASYISRFINMDIAPALSQIELPVRILMGDAEPNSQDTVRKYEELLKDRTIVYVPRSKHFPHIENPEVVLQSFIEENNFQEAVSK
jgi:pimeloyl-ACP methyl ester carboxylesterase